MTQNKRCWVLLFTIVLSVAAVVGLFWHKPANHSASLIQQILHKEVEEFIPDQNIDLKNTIAFHQKDSIYSDFRSNFRMHFQAIGLATFADSSRLILISEPPPYFEIDSIQSICKKFTHKVEVKTHKIGYDGHINDLLLIIGNATTENVNHLVKDLSKKIYLSDYKPNTINLPITEPRSYFVKENLSYEITLDEFNAWFMEDGEKFFKLSDTAHCYTVQQFFEKKMRGVYFSQIPGFVAWCVAKNQDLQVQDADIRQFALDADLVLGALADSSTLVIIAREREAKLTELPPLNVESVLLLASVTEKELSQSLDVNDFLAGKMNNGHDWCPTYLSKELENTEFGHLLTITDVLLKDWSENGTIQEAYYRYPSPPRFPFDRPLFDKLGLSELVYNWNTWNAMYAIDMEGYTIYSLNNTGSLPVSYFSSPERSVSIGRQYERQAYHYFSHLGNTDLARVVQYTALYQLFMDNKITYKGNLPHESPKNKPYLLYGPCKSFLNFFKNLNSSQTDYYSDTIAKKNFTDFQKKQVVKQLAKNEKNYQFTYTDAQRAEIFQNVLKDNQRHIKQTLQEVREMLNNLSEKDFNQLARYLSYPRGMSASGQVTEALYRRGQKVNNLMRIIGKNNLYIFNTDLQQVRNFYVGQLAKTSARYVKTPSIIVTYNDMVTTGGHNLSSGITRVNSLTNYHRGNGTVHATPSSPPKAPSSGTVPKTTNAPAKSSPPTQNKTTGNKPTASTKAPARAPSSTASVRARSSVVSSGARPTRGF